MYIFYVDLRSQMLFTDQETLNMWCIQARSQGLEKGGGAFLEECEKCKRPWPEFLLFLNQNFSETSEMQTFFPPKIRWSPKKKKRSSPKLRLIFRPKSEIQTFFPPKNRWSPKWKNKKNKKKVFTEIETDFSAPPPPPLATLLDASMVTYFWNLYTRSGMKWLVDCVTLKPNCSLVRLLLVVK